MPPGAHVESSLNFMSGGASKRNRHFYVAEFQITFFTNFSERYFVYIIGGYPSDVFVKYGRFNSAK